MGCGKQNFVSVAVRPAPVRVPSHRPLTPSVASVTSVANDKGDIEMILGAVHRSPGICLTAEGVLLIVKGSRGYYRYIGVYPIMDYQDVND